MAIIVKMDLPDRCENCQLCHFTANFRHISVCGVANRKFSDEEQEAKERPDWCPIIGRYPENEEIK